MSARWSHGMRGNQQRLPLLAGQTTLVTDTLARIANRAGLRDGRACAMSIAASAKRDPVFARKTDRTVDSLNLSGDEAALSCSQIE